MSVEKVLEDGTRVYSNYTSYTPVKAEDRVYAVRRPSDPRAVRFRGDWFVPLDLVPDDRRTMPPTRPYRDGRAPVEMPAHMR